MTKSRHRKSRWQDPILVAGPVQQFQHNFHPLYAFGFDGFSERRAQVACVDLHVIVYGLGGNVVFHSISGDKGMKFFSSSVAVEAVLWVEASAGGSLVVACEKLKTGLCQVSIIDVKKLEAVNTFSAYGNGEFGACAFSSNERQFLAACNAEHSAQLDFWDIRDGRVLLSTTIPHTVTKISFNPDNDEEFAVSGPSYFKFWSIKGGLKKEIHVQGLHDQKDKATQEVTYTDHAWLVETSVALSSMNGKIFIIRNYALQHVIMDTGNTLCLLRTHRGFLAGKQNGSLMEYIGFDLYKVKVAEKEQKNPYAEVRPIVFLSGLSSIASIVMPPHGEQIIYMVEGDKIVKVQMGVGDDEDALLGTDTSARIVPLSVFRMGKISGIDICSQRMLLVTCGSDCLLRVWSYQRMLCEICHICDEEPFLVTISPWGHYLFVAMARRIQVFRIVGYKLQHCKDIGGVKNIKQLKFSPSGHMVAAANSREILIICAFTWTIKATLKGHTGGVTALAWSPDSVYLMSAGLDGAIYGWFLDGYHRYLEYVIKGSTYSCLLVDQERTFILACGPSLSIRVIDTDKKLISHGKEFSVIGEELLVTQKDSKEAPEGGGVGFLGTLPMTPENSQSRRSHSISPTVGEPIIRTLRSTSIFPTVGEPIIRTLRSTSISPSAGEPMIRSLRSTSISPTAERAVEEPMIRSLQTISILHTAEEPMNRSLRSSSISPTHEEPMISQFSPPPMKEGQLGSTPFNTPGFRKRDSTFPTEENPEGSWVQHKFRSNCMFELKHEKPATLMAVLFKTGVLVTTAPGGELQIYNYPFQRDAPNLLKEVVLLSTGEITGLCLDEDHRLIFACTTQGSIFISTIDLEVVGPKVDDPYEEEIMAMQEVVPIIPGIMQYLQDTGTDALNILLERNELEEMKRDLEELKLTMAREVKDASFRAQRAALEWSAGMKEREAGYLAREKEYEVQVKILSHNLHLAVSEKETAIQELLDAQRSTVQQLEDFYQNKLAQELERSHISRKQFQKDLANLEMGMKDKEQIYLEKMVILEKELEGADAVAQEAIKRVRDECNKVNENYKMEMEEDLLLSDEELNKALEKLNADVNVEKERADENFEQLLLQKRHVMQVEKKMKDMQAVHTEHVELIEKLTSENEELKKTIMELDYEKRILKKVVLLTDEKTQHLVHERKDQETKTIVRDFKIQQLRKREQPLEREVAQLRFQLREMERHQLSHVMEMQHQTLIVDNLKARMAAMDEDNQKLSDQLHERECYVDMFTRALCQLVQEHDVSEWPQLTKQLYFTYVKDVHRTETIDHLDAYGEVMHQRENLEKFVAILQKEIGRSEVRNWRETQKYMQQNLEMLHEYNEAQRNVKRLAFMTQKLQGDVVYWKATAAKPEKRLRPTMESYMSPSKTTPQLDNNQSNSISRCSKSTRKSTPSNRIRASLVSSAELSRASSPGLNETQLSQSEEQFKEQFRSSTPVAHILKPYLHRGTIAAAATSRYSFVQNRPWSPEPQSDIVLDLNILVNDMKKELRKKDEIIEQLQRNSRLSSTCNYLPLTRSQSIFESSIKEKEPSIRSPGVQFSPSLYEDINSMEDTASRRPKSVPTLSFGANNYQRTNQKPQTNPVAIDTSNATNQKPQTNQVAIDTSNATCNPFLSREKSWVPRYAEDLDMKQSADLAKVEMEQTIPPSSTTTTSPIPSPSRRSSSPTGMSTIIFDGDSLHAKSDASSSPSRRSPSPTDLILLEPFNNSLAHRRASSLLFQPGTHQTSSPEVNLLQRASSPGPGPQTHPRILTLQMENSHLNDEKFSGVEPLSSALSPPRRKSLSPPPQLEVSVIDVGSELKVPQPPSPSFNSLAKSPMSAIESDVPSGAIGADHSTLATAPFHRRKSSLMIVETADSNPRVNPLKDTAKESNVVGSLSPLIAAAVSPPLLPIPSQGAQQPLDSSSQHLQSEDVIPPPSNPMSGSTFSTHPDGGASSSAGEKLPRVDQIPPATPFKKRKPSLMKVQTTPLVPVNPPEVFPRRKSTLTRVDSAPSSSSMERRGSALILPSSSNQRRPSRFETTFLGSQAETAISELQEIPSSTFTPTKKRSIIALPDRGATSSNRRSSTMKADAPSTTQNSSSPANLHRRWSSIKLDSPKGAARQSPIDPASALAQTQFATNSSESPSTSSSSTKVIAPQEIVEATDPNPTLDASPLYAKTSD